MNTKKVFLNRIRCWGGNAAIILLLLFYGKYYVNAHNITVQTQRKYLYRLCSLLMLKDTFHIILIIASTHKPIALNNINSV